MSLPLGRLTFLNRKEQLRQINILLAEEVQHEPVAFHIKAESDSGISRFLEEVSHKQAKSSIAIRINGTDKSTGSAFSQIALALYTFYPKHYRELSAYMERRAGRNLFREFVPHIALEMPVLGSFAKALLQKKLLDPRKNYEQFPSILSGMTSDFLRELAREERLSLFIDDAQDLDPLSRDLLRVTGSQPYSRIRYVIGETSRGTSTGGDPDNTLEDELGSLGYAVRAAEFKRPENEFVQLLCEHAGLHLSPQRIEELRQRTHGRMRRLISEVRRAASTGGIGSSEEPDWRPLETEILSLVLTARQAVRLSDIKAICLDSPDVFFEDASEVDQAIRYLKIKELIETIEVPGGDILVSTHAFSDRNLETLQADYILRLRSEKKLYDFAIRLQERRSARHSETELVPLLYRLSKTQAPQRTHEFARKLVELSLATGSYENARRFIDEAIANDQAIEIRDRLVLAALLMAIRRFSEALEFLDGATSIPESASVQYDALRAVCLNRVRRHSEADLLMNRLLEQQLAPQTALILYAYKIAGLIHEDDVKRAQATFWQVGQKYGDQPAHIYFVRNASAAFPPAEARQQLESALETVRNSEDAFLVASLQNNLAARYLELQLPQFAIPLLLEARERLAIFGIHHLHIVDNNLGLAYCLINKIEQAILHLKRARISSHSTLPSMYIEFNLALCRFCSGETKLVAAHIERARAALESPDHFSRIDQKFYANAALLFAATGANEDKVSALCINARRHQDRQSPEITWQLLDFIDSAPLTKKISVSVVKKLFLPCTLEYWYMNPLDLIDEYMLAPDTEG